MKLNVISISSTHHIHSFPSLRPPQHLALQAAATLLHISWFSETAVSQQNMTTPASRAVTAPLPGVDLSFTTLPTGIPMAIRMSSHTHLSPRVR